MSRVYFPRQFALTYESMMTNWLEYTLAICTKPTSLNPHAFSYVLACLVN